MELFLEKSPHVQHMRVHRELYASAVGKFLVRVCSDGDGSSSTIPAAAAPPLA